MSVAPSVLVLDDGELDNVVRMLVELELDVVRLKGPEIKRSVEAPLEEAAILSIEDGWSLLPLIQPPATAREQRAALRYTVLVASAFLITDLMPFPGAIAIIPVLGTALVTGSCDRWAGVSCAMLGGRTLGLDENR